MKHYLIVMLFLAICLGIFTTAYAADADSTRIRVINIRTNYYGTIYVNGVSTGTSLNYGSANFTQAGTYTIVCSNSRITFTPSEFYWDGTYSHLLYFQGVANPYPASNPSPSDGALITLPAGSSATTVTLGWQSYVMNGGYKLYWDGAVDPIIVPDYNISTNHTWVTPAIGAGAHTWKIVPYTNDPPDPNGKLANGDSNDAKGDCTNAVDWYFTIEEEVVWDYPACIATPIDENPDLIITPIINIDNGGMGDFIIDYIFSSLALDEENPPEFLYASMLIGETAGIADFSVASNQPGRLYAVYLNEDMSWSRATPYMINVLDTDPIVPQSWLFDDVNFFQAGKQGRVGIGLTVVVISSADVLPFDFPQGDDTPYTYQDISILPSEDLTLDFTVDENHPILTALPNYGALGEKKVVGLSGTGNSVDILVTAPAGSWYGKVYYGGVWYQSSPVHIEAGAGVRTFNFTGVDFTAKVGEVIILLSEGEAATLPVELSSFDAMLTAQSYVSLNWVSESETNLSGYYVYRSTEESLATAQRINTLIPAQNTSQTTSYNFIDNDTVVDNTYYYWLQALELDGTFSYHGPQSITVIDSGNSAPEIVELSLLSNAFPNPFRTGNSTNINVSVKTGETGCVTIYNIRGQAVKTFPLTSGTHTVKWDGKGCSNGMYLYKLSTPSVNTSRKVLLLK